MTSLQHQEIERLEHAFWQSMVDGQPDVATGMLTEPALMVSGHGAMQFDHAGYETMARNDRHRLVGFDLRDMQVVFPRTDVAIATYRASQDMEMDGQPVKQEAVDSSTWVRFHEGWKCVAHTESLQARPD
jgi:hypothetical protein